MCIREMLIQYWIFPLPNTRVQFKIKLIVNMIEKYEKKNILVDLQSSSTSRVNVMFFQRYNFLCSLNSQYPKS